MVGEVVQHATNGDTKKTPHTRHARAVCDCVSGGCVTVFLVVELVCVCARVCVECKRRAGKWENGQNQAQVKTTGQPLPM